MSEYIYGTDGHEGHWLTGEEIVRCRDCARSTEGKTWDGKPVLVCKRFSTYNARTEPDGFCAWGVRRTDG